MASREPRRISVIDSHTGGEPTRVVVSGGPDLGRGSMAERREVFRREQDAFRSAIVNEPRGSDVIVGALLCEPVDPSCAAGVIFFNNVGYISMCGHGTIGLAVTLAHTGRIGPGVHRIETPVGVVTVTLHDANTATVENVPSYRFRRDVSIEGHGGLTFTGDVAWGGNWFFLVEGHGEDLVLGDAAWLTEVCQDIRQSLAREGIRGDDGSEIDHIELFGPPKGPGAHSRNFVLCPGGMYDRSPCGTGTSAKVACLVADGRLAEGQTWRQESILGSVFEASVRIVEGRVLPRIKGTAYVTAEATLILDPADPFCWGIRP
jgi:4-hydroxyproline epimerase